MKIYFSGCHGSGKTTCARYVSENYKLPIITEIARVVLSEKELQIDSLRYDVKLVNEYQSAVFAKQIEEEGKYSSFVSDRCVIDCLAYSAQHTDIFPKLVRSPDLAPYLDNLRDSKSILFFVRPTKATLKSDGVRESINWDGAVAIDAMLKLLFEMFEIRYFQINTDNMQERIKLINSVLNMYKS